MFSNQNDLDQSLSYYKVNHKDLGFKAYKKPAIISEVRKRLDIDGKAKENEHEKDFRVNYKDNSDNF